MKKRVLSALLVAALVISSIPVQVLAVDAPVIMTQQETASTQDAADSVQDAEGGAQGTEGTAQDTEGDSQGTAGTAQDTKDSAQGTEDTAQSNAKPSLLANGSITYIDSDGSLATYTSEYTLVTAGTTEWTDMDINAGWYLAEGGFEISQQVNVTGDVTLILADGADLTVTGGIKVSAGGSLTITAQSKGDNMGEMTVNCPNDPGIGIGGENSTVIIWGGAVSAKAYTVGIGGENSTVIIRNGVVSASSSRADGIFNYAIGGGNSTVIISGGRVTTACSRYNGYDVGCSQLSTDKPDGSNGNALLCAGAFNVGIESLDYISVNRNGSPECIYGEVTLGDDLVIESGQTLTIPAGTKLIVPAGVTLTNEGTILVKVGGRYVGAETAPNKVEYETVNYLDENGEIRTKRADEVTLATNSIKELNDKDGGWYLVTEDAWARSRLSIEGNVTLILGDEAKFRAEEGIEVNGGNSLTITAQSNGEDMGELIVTATKKSLCAGIGGDEYRFDGSITINGGWITASAENGAGIGGISQIGDQNNPSNGSITINGGIVNATGGLWAPGIGIGGDDNSRVIITITGGEVTATGGPIGGSGIGTRENCSNGFDIIITGGIVRAIGQNGGAGIGTGMGAHSDSLSGSIEISGGVVTAISGGNGAAAIGDGDNPTGTRFSTGEGGHAVIYAASITGSDDADGWNCIWFESEDGDGKVCGSVTLDGVLTVSQNATLTIPAGATLAVPADASLTNYGSIKVALGGVYSGKQPAGDKVTYWVGWDNDEDGEAEVSDYIPYGEMPNYTGAEPVKANTAQYTYTFSGWSPEVVAVNGSRLYTAQFTAKAIVTPPDPVEPDVPETVEKTETAKEQLDQVTGYKKKLTSAVKEKPEAVPDATEENTAAAGDYRILSGDGSSWTKGEAEGLTIVANGAPEQLIDLLLDGSSIASEQYEIREGSTIVTLKPAYLDTLAVGEHTLTFVYENGQVSADFTIAEAQSKTQIGDTGNPVLLGGMAILCISALAGLFIWKRRKKAN